MRYTVEKENNKILINLNLIKYLFYKDIIIYIYIL